MLEKQIVDIADLYLHTKLYTSVYQVSDFFHNILVAVMLFTELTASVNYGPVNTQLFGLFLQANIPWRQCLQPKQSGWSIVLRRAVSLHSSL